MKLLNFFRRSDYQSETTQFINALKLATPTIEAGQLTGRALLWDKTVSAEMQADYRSSRVSQKAYVYSGS